MDIEILFADLSEAVDSLDRLTKDRQSAMDAATPPEVRAAWAKIADEFDPQIFAARKNVQDLYAEIKKASLLENMLDWELAGMGPLADEAAED